MEFATPYNREPDDADVASCSCCGRKIDLNYEDYHEIAGEYYCTACSSNVTICSRCGREVLKEDLKGPEKNLCEYCYDDLYVIV